MRPYKKLRKDLNKILKALTKLKDKLMKENARNQNESVSRTTGN